MIDSEGNSVYSTWYTPAAYAAESFPYGIDDIYYWSEGQLFVNSVDGGAEVIFVPEESITISGSYYIIDDGTYNCEQWDYWISESHPVDEFTMTISTNPTPTVTPTETVCTYDSCADINVSETSYYTPISDCEYIALYPSDDPSNDLCMGIWGGGMTCGIGENGQVYYTIDNAGSYTWFSALGSQWDSCNFTVTSTSPTITPTPVPTPRSCSCSDITVGETSYSDGYPGEGALGLSVQNGDIWTNLCFCDWGSCSCPREGAPSYLFYMTGLDVGHYVWWSDDTSCEFDVLPVTPTLMCGGDYNGIYTCCPSAERLSECKNSSDEAGCAGCTRPTCGAVNGVLACCPSVDDLDSCMLSSSVSCPTCSSGCSGCIYPTLENWLNYYNNIGVVKVAGGEFDPSIGKTVFGRYLGIDNADSYQMVADDVGANKFNINVGGLTEEQIQKWNDLFTRAAGKDAAENGGRIFVTERPPTNLNDPFWESETGFPREMKILKDEFKGVVTEERVPVTGPTGVTRYLYEVEIPAAAEIINTIIMCALI